MIPGDFISVGNSSDHIYQAYSAPHHGLKFQDHSAGKISWELLTWNEDWNLECSINNTAMMSNFLIYHFSRVLCLPSLKKFSISQTPTPRLRRWDFHFQRWVPQRAACGAMVIWHECNFTFLPHCYKTLYDMHFDSWCVDITNTHTIINSPSSLIRRRVARSSSILANWPSYTRKWVCQCVIVGSFGKEKSCRINHRARRVLTIRYQCRISFL